VQHIAQTDAAQGERRHVGLDLKKGTLRANLEAGAGREEERRRERERES
jgi:hypothetical protein